MNPLITNAWAGWLPDPVARRHFSRVVVEGCGDLTGYLRVPDPSRLVFTAPGARLNMPPATLPVHDGVVEGVEIRETASGVVVEAGVAVPTTARLSLVSGTPARAVIDLSAAPLLSLFAGRLFVLDAGHGTPDAGSRGPIDLLEKDVVRDMVLRLERLIAQVGGVPVLTRRGDASPPPERRSWTARQARPTAVLSLHTHAAPDPRTSGFASFYADEPSRPLAEAVHQSLVRKLGLVDRGLFPAAGPFFSPAAHRPAEQAFAGTLGPPTAVVETVTITNPVEEGWLRSYVFRQKVAQAFFHGLAAWLRVTGPGPKS